jgi:SAM-dependent methyltransferase
MPDINSPSFWDELYESGQTGWDLERPTPVFKRLLGEGQLIPGKMLVLCAGRGYDARLFAEAGFDVIAVDIAEEAVREMRERVEKNSQMEVLRADLFELPDKYDGTFDYVLEYTCYCAIDPKRRAEYVKKVDQLLNKGGTYIALAYPIGGHAGGPPYTVSSDELIDPFVSAGYTLQRFEIPDDSVPERLGLEALIVLGKN